MKKKRKKKSGGERGRDEGVYVCPSCGEEIVIPLELGGREQEYVEDCPVCCNPNVIHVEIEEGWEEPRVWAEAE